MNARILPAKDKSIAAAQFEGAGREVEYRIEGNPGRPGRAGTEQEWPKC